MKKLLALLLSLVMVMCLFAACDSDDDDGDGKGSASGSYEDPVERALKAICLQVTEQDCKDMFPEEYWEENDFDEYWENTESRMDASRDAMEEQIGKNAKYSYEITEKTELDEDELEEIKTALSDQYGIDADDVEKAYSLDFEFCIEGDDDKVESSSDDSIVVCIRGQWYQYPF